jgi:hypothetical protein
MAVKRKTGKTGKKKKATKKPAPRSPIPQPSPMRKGSKSGQS